MFNSFRIVALLFAVVAVYYTVYDGEQYVNLERRAAVSLGKREGIYE